MSYSRCFLDTYLLLYASTCIQIIGLTSSHSTPLRFALLSYIIPGGYFRVHKFAINKNAKMNQTMYETIIKCIFAFMKKMVIPVNTVCYWKMCTRTHTHTHLPYTHATTGFLTFWNENKILSVTQRLYCIVVRLEMETTQWQL